MRLKISPRALEVMARADGGYAAEYQRLFGVAPLNDDANPFRYPDPSPFPRLRLWRWLP